VSAYDAERVEAVTFEENSLLRIAVDELLADTSLGEHVVKKLRPAMFGMGRGAVEFWPGPLPVAAWSSGEKSLWLFLASLSGHQPINLYGLAAQFKGTPEAGHITKIINILFHEGH
jgi:hypothetical protein